MTAVEYFKDKLLLLTLHLSCMMALAAFLYVTNYPASNICIILLVWMLVLSAWFLTEYLRRRQYFRQMAEILENAEQKYLLGELMPRSFRLEDQLYRDMIRQSNKSVIEKIRSVEDARTEYREYIESWIHEVKAPIADINLLCERLRQEGAGFFVAESPDTPITEIARRILQENQKTENCVDMALFYARSDEVYKDYLIKETTLQQTAEDVLRKNKFYLIQNRI